MEAQKIEKSAEPAAESVALESFRAEIAEIKRVEMEKMERGEKYDPHFEHIESQFLTEADMNIYKKIDNGTLKLEEFREYQLTGEAKGMDALTDPRINFMGWLGNKVNSGIWRERFFGRKG